MATTMGTETTANESDLVAVVYEPFLAAARNRYETGVGYRTMTDPAVAVETLDRFLIEFCAQGVHLTRPVDDWITRAGLRCAELGMHELGAALQRHAVHEAGHHEMMIADTRRLVDEWNEAGRSPLDADSLLARDPLPGARQYIALHEKTIVSPDPWGQLAIEYEIERLSITAGHTLIANVAAVCGPERVGSLSFLTDHIAVDEGHTVFNRRQLNQVLGERPALAVPLAAAGSAALDAHARFIDDCAEVATT